MTEQAQKVASGRQSDLLELAGYRLTLNILSMADENDHEGRGLADRSLDLTGEARPSGGIPVNTLMTRGRR
jgi:hypothetical protein